MRVVDLNPESRKLWERMSRQSNCSQVRDRAKCIILSSQGFPIKELMKIFKVSRKTIFNWLIWWEYQGILGLYNQRGRGRKPQFNLWPTKQVQVWVKSALKALNRIPNQIPKTGEINVSKYTRKRIIKKLGIR